MTRFFCDGCDQEVGDTGTMFILLMTKQEFDSDCMVKRGSPPFPNAFHACQQCQSKLRAAVDLAKWPRT